MTDSVAAYAAEARELLALLRALPAATLDLPTQFRGWTFEDTVLHLYAGDQLGLLALGDPQRFAVLRGEVIAARAAGRSALQETRQRIGPLGGAALIDAYAAQLDDLVLRLTKAPAGARIAWFGPDMAVSTFATARLMETWAHGHTLRDALGRPGVIVLSVQIGALREKSSFKNNRL